MKPFDLSKLKSAKPVTGASAIAELLSRAIADEANAAGRAPYGHSVVVSKDGRAEIKKYTGAAVRRGKAISSDQVRKLAEKSGVVWNDALAGRAVPYWASDERPDGHGDIVRQQWSFEEYSKNPVLCMGHDWVGPAIGRGIDYEVRQRTDADYKGPALWMLALFADAEAQAENDRVFRLVRSGFMSAASVGFYSDRVIIVEDEQERMELGLGKYGYILEDNHLLELSPVTLPANIGAHVVQDGSAMTLMAHGKQKHGLRPDDVDFMREMARRGYRLRGDGAAWTAEQRTLIEAARTVWPDHEFAELDLDDEDAEPEAKRISGGVLAKAIEDQIGQVKEAVDRIEAALGDTLPKLAQRIDDLRGLTESIAEKSGVKCGEDEDDEDDEDDDSKAAEPPPEASKILSLLRGAPKADAAAG